MVNKMKRQAINLEKIVAKHILSSYPECKQNSFTQRSKGENKKGIAQWGRGTEQKL